MCRSQARFETLPPKSAPSVPASAAPTKANDAWSLRSPWARSKNAIAHCALAKIAMLFTTAPAKVCSNAAEPAMRSAAPSGTAAEGAWARPSDQPRGGSATARSEDARVGDARDPGAEEEAAPAEGRERASGAEPAGGERAQRGPHGQDAERAAAPLGRDVVHEQRAVRRSRRRLTEAHGETGRQEGGEASHRGAGGGGRAPEGDAGRVDRAAREPIGAAAEHEPAQEVGEGEGHHEPAELRVAEREVCADGVDRDGQDLAMEEFDEYREREQRDDAPHLARREERALVGHAGYLRTRVPAPETARAP